MAAEWRAPIAMWVHARARLPAPGMRFAVPVLREALGSVRGRGYEAVAHGDAPGVATEAEAAEQLWQAAREAWDAYLARLEPGARLVAEIDVVTGTESDRVALVKSCFYGDADAEAVLSSLVYTAGVDALNDKSVVGDDGDCVAPLDHYISRYVESVLEDIAQGTARRSTSTNKCYVALALVEAGAIPSAYSCLLAAELDRLGKTANADPSVLEEYLQIPLELAARGFPVGMKKRKRHRC